MASDHEDRSAVDARWMTRALELAERGRWTVSPNPLVGCVLVRGDEVVGEGWHTHAGGDHAEVAALTAAGRGARGATAYVTLEPCAHEGRTGPCVEALASAGVSRVVAGLRDPNPEAAGGIDALRARGIDVTVGVLADEVTRQNEVFLHAIESQRPFVTVKVATSLDGRIAAADGTSKWLTGRRTRQDAHRLRAEADAVLVGSGTVLADDPHLTVRLDGYRGRQPLRVVLDGRGRTRPGHRVHDRSAPTLCVLRRDGDRAMRSVLGSAGVRVVTVDDGDELRGLLDLLWERNVRSVLVEGGAQVAGAFVAAGLVDRLVVYVAPVLLGDEGHPAFAGLPIPTLDAAPRWEATDIARIGDDTVITCRPTTAAATQAPLGVVAGGQDASSVASPEAPAPAAEPDDPITRDAERPEPDDASAPPAAERLEPHVAPTPAAPEADDRPDTGPPEATEPPATRGDNGQPGVIGNAPLHVAASDEDPEEVLTRLLGPAGGEDDEPGFDESTDELPILGEGET